MYPPPVIIFFQINLTDKTQHIGLDYSMQCWQAIIKLLDQVLSCQQTMAALEYPVHLLLMKLSSEQASN